LSSEDFVSSLQMQFTLLWACSGENFFKRYAE